MALAGVVCAESKTSWTMDELAALATNTGTKAAVSTEWTYGNGNVYTFSNGSYLGGFSDSDLLSSIGLADGTCITIAAWVRAESLSGYQAIFGYGGNGEGLVLTLKNGDFMYISDGVAERGSAPSKLEAGEWGLIAMSFVVGSKATTNDQGDVSYTTSNGRIHDALGGFYTRQIGSYATPDAADQLFSIGSRNGSSAKDTFTGDIAGLTIFTGGTTGVNYADIQARLGSAPVLVPEPATATLSLLALAGLAVRRRRK